jgi:hypothetical protein
MGQASAAQKWAASLSMITKALVQGKSVSTTKEMKTTSFEAPIYKANIAKLGLLGVSLAADVIMVCSVAKEGVVMKLENAIPNEMLATIYENNASSLLDWHADLYHVAMRIRAEEEGTPDAGTLLEAREKREKAKAEKTKA